jgi:hypothetical protein
VDWGREAQRKKLGNFDLRKGFAKCTMRTKLEGRRFDLVRNTNPRQRSDAEPSPCFSRVGLWDLGVLTLTHS